MGQRKVVLLYFLTYLLVILDIGVIIIGHP